MRGDDTYLLDMLVAARKAVKFAAGLTFVQFEQSDLHQNALFKVLEIVGEAASRISDDTKPGFPSCSPFDDRAADEAIIKRRFARAACRMVRTGDGKRASGRAGSRGA